MTEARLQELESLLCECAANARDHRAGDAVDEICDELRAAMSQLSDDELIVIGVDTDDGAEHPLWDSRAFLPMEDPEPLAQLARMVAFSWWEKLMG